MKKTTLLFNKFNVLIASCFFGVSAAAQCPQDITVSAPAGACGAEVTFTAPVNFAGGPSANGVVNPVAGNGYGGWTVVNGGSGWTQSGVYFLSSYMNCTMTQVIDLTTMNLSDTYMDTQPAITVSEDYIGWMVDFADYYSLTVQLLGENNNVITSYTTGTINTSNVLQTASHVFTGYGAGVRKVSISHTGKDVEYWSGQYGAAVTNVQCTVMMPAYTVAQTAGLSSGDEYPIGTTTNTYTLTYADNTTETCSFDVVVTDEEAPTIAVQQTIVATLGEDGTATITTADVDNGTVDNCEDNTLSLSLDVTSFTCENLGENTVTLTASDGTNTATQTAVVTVVDNTAPELNVQTVSIYLNAEGSATLAQADVDAGSTDNCGIATFTLSKEAFTCEDLGDSTVTVTATDASGNVTTAEVVVTVIDNVPPVASMQNVTIQLGADGTAVLGAADIDNNSTDNCGIVSWELDTTAFTCEDLGENLITLTVTDGAGLTDTIIAIVTVEDTEGVCVTSGIEGNLANAVKLYPNPAGNVLNISAAGYTVTKVELLDINGRPVSGIETVLANGQLTADVSALSGGVYFVKLYAAEGVAIKKLIKE